MAAFIFGRRGSYLQIKVMASFTSSLLTFEVYFFFEFDVLCQTLYLCALRCTLDWYSEGTQFETIVPQLSKCLKFEAVWGVLTDQMI